MAETTTDGHDYGPLRTYEITWTTRPPEMVQGHSVQFDSGGLDLFGTKPHVRKFRIYGMFPGECWRLVICGREDDVITIRDVTDQVASLEAMADEVTGDATSA